MMFILSLRKVIFVVLFVALVLLYISVAMRVPMNSDGASALLIARDISVGNIFLQGWTLSTVSFYFTELLPYAVAIKIFGWSISLYYIIPSIMLAALVLLSIYLCRRNCPSSVWPIIVVFAAPGFFAANMMLVPSIHMGAYVASLICWVLVEDYREKGGRWRLAVLCSLLSVILFSDDIVRYFLLLPLCLACVFFFFKERSVRDLQLFACAVVAFVVGKIIGGLFEYFNGFAVPGVGSVNFVAYDAIGNNLSLALQGILTFFDGDFFGKQIASINGLGKAAHAIFALAWSFAFFRVVKRVKDLSFLGFAWFLSAFIMLFAYVFSSLPVDIMTTRYLVPFFLFGSLAIACEINLELHVRKWVGGVALVYALSFIIQLGSQPLATGWQNAVVVELDKRGLKQGYATFWNASVNSLISNAQIAPVLISERVTPMRWLSKDQWYIDGGNFLICDSSNEVEVAQSQFGLASETIGVGDKFLLVWGDSFLLR